MSTFGFGFIYDFENALYYMLALLQKLLLNIQWKIQSYLQTYFYHKYPEDDILQIAE